MSKIVSVIAAIIAAVIQWIKGSRESETRTDNRVQQLEENAAKDRLRDLREFDEKAVAISGPDDAVELLRSVTAQDTDLN